VILFLDDDLNRCDSFKRKVPHAKFVHTAQQCINKLKEGDWELVCLDHDLGGEIYVDTEREDCGMEVVRWIVANEPKIDKIIIHSYNSSAAYMMKNLLKDDGYDVDYVPFSLLLENIQEIQ